MVTDNSNAPGCPVARPAVSIISRWPVCSGLNEPGSSIPGATPSGLHSTVGAAHQPPDIPGQQCLQRFRKGCTLYLERVACCQPQVQFRVQPGKFGQGLEDKTAYHVLLTGPVPQSFVKRERPSGDGGGVPRRYYGPVVSPLGAVGGDRGGAGKTEHRLRLLPAGGARAGRRPSPCPGRFLPKRTGRVHAPPSQSWNWKRRESPPPAPCVRPRQRPLSKLWRWCLRPRRPTLLAVANRESSALLPGSRPYLWRLLFRLRRHAPVAHYICSGNHLKTRRCAQPVVVPSPSLYPARRCTQPVVVPSPLPYPTRHSRECGNP